MTAPSEGREAAGCANPDPNRELCAKCGYTFAGHISNTGNVYPCWTPSGRYQPAPAATPESGHPCPRCRQPCDCAEFYDGDPCCHAETHACTPATPPYVNGCLKCEDGLIESIVPGSASKTETSFCSDDELYIAKRQVREALKQCEALGLKLHDFSKAKILSRIDQVIIELQVARELLTKEAQDDV